MIAKSDLIILVVSSTLLGLAIYRWDQNTRNVDTSTVLANTRVVAPAQPDNLTVNDSVTTAATSTATPAAPAVESTPVETIAAVVEVAPTVEEAIRPFSTHVVRSGDSLSAIAARYDTSVSELRELNGIRGSTILIGQEIIYPAN